MHVNVLTHLSRRNVAHRVHRHSDLPLPIASPADFASQLGYPLNRITKTLLIRSTAGGPPYAVVVAPMGSKIDFRSIAALLGAKRVEMAPAADLQRLTGYPERGVSPLGLAELPVFMEESLFQFPTVLIGAGEAGVEVEISPVDLQELTGAARFGTVAAEVKPPAS